MTFPAIALGGAGSAPAQVIGEAARVLGRQLVPDEAVDQPEGGLTRDHTLYKAQGRRKVAAAGATPQPASEPEPFPGRLLAGGTLDPTRQTDRQPDLARFDFDLCGSWNALQVHPS